MAEQPMEPWSFTIVFDEKKAQQNGYDVETLYDYVGINVEKYGNKRVGHGTWTALPEHDEVNALALSLSALSRRKWVMQNLKSLTYREDEPETYDALDTIRRVNPERIYD